MSWEAKLVEEIRRNEGQHGHGDTGKRALVIKTSHIGGHKFAGNLIVYSPRGTGVWYGRVSPKEVSDFYRTRGVFLLAYLSVCER